MRHLLCAIAALTLLAAPAALVADISAPPGVTVASGGYSVYPERSPGKPTLWHGQQTLNLESDAAADLLQLVGDLQSQGLNTQGLTFEVKDETLRQAQDGLTADALTQLRARADSVAADLNMSVQQIRDITVGNAEGGARPPMPMFTARAAGISAAPTPVAEPGDAEVSVTVQAEVWLSPKGQ